MTLTNRFYVLKQSKGRMIRGDYAGGAYIDLTFGSSAYKPTEVINVWDDAAGEAMIPCTNRGVRRAIEDWIDEQDAEWPEWYECYLENA